MGSILLSVFVENKIVEFLVDTEAETTITDLDFLNSLPRVIRTASQKKTTTIYVADGNKLLIQRPVMCLITVAGRRVLETIYAANISVRAILGLPAMNALKLCMTGRCRCSWGQSIERKR